MKNPSSKLPWALAALFAAISALFFLQSLAGRAGKTGGPPREAAAVSGAKKILYWVDPMHPAYKSDKPGTAPDCGMDLVPVYDDGSTGDSGMGGVEGHSTLTLTARRQQLIGVRIGKVERRDLARTIHTVGRVTVDERLLFQFRAKFEGFVEELFADYTGKPVRKGDPLLSIYSPDLLATQQEYLLATRARRRFTDGATSELRDAGEALYQSARQRLLLWDISPADIERLERTGRARKALTLYSPVDGVVVAKAAIRGARVMPGDTLFEIAGLHHVWVLADVYESEIPFVRVGQAARMSLSYIPGRSWRGRVTFIAPVLDEKTRTVKVRLEFMNPDGILKPEMYADVSLPQRLDRAVAVPEGAVLATGKRSIVFLALGEGHFEPREVKLGVKTDGYYQVLEGLTPGEQVVTQANFLVDSESRLKSALAEMSSGSPAPAPGAPAGETGSTAKAPASGHAGHGL